MTVPSTAAKWQPAPTLLQPRVRSRLRRQRPAVVTLHVYDVTDLEAIQGLNVFFRAVGTGAFHAGVEVYGSEWSFGFAEDDGTGVFCCSPRGCSLGIYREPVVMGTTGLSATDVQLLVEGLCVQWQGRDYDFLRRNCCHFSDHLCRQLGVGPLPGWVTNLAGAGATLDTGLRHVSSSVQTMVIVAAAKAGELDEAYQIWHTVVGRALGLLAAAGDLDEKYQVLATARLLTVQAGASLGELAARAADGAGSALSLAAERAVGAFAADRADPMG